MALVALVTLIAWWDSDPATSTDNVIGNHPGKLSAMALSPDGRWLASGGNRGAVMIWDLVRTKVEAELDKRGSPVSGLACSPDGRVLAAGRFDGTVTVWETGSWLLRQEFQAGSQALSSLAFSPDGKVLATAGLDPKVALWDTANWSPRGTLSGHHGPVLRVGFSPDGRTLASSSADDTLRLWDVAAESTIRVIRPRPLERHPVPRALALSPEGRLLAAPGPGPESSSGTSPAGGKRGRWASARGWSRA